jgi:hypothetical protein
MSNLKLAALLVATSLFIAIVVTAVQQPAHAQATPATVCMFAQEGATMEKINAFIETWMTTQRASGHVGFVMVPIGQSGRSTLCAY